MRETNFQVKTHDSHLSPEEFRKLPRHPIYVVLDNLRSAFNVGSIVRSADCARVQKVFFCGITAHPPNPKVIKTAMGAMDYVAWEYCPTTVEAVEKIKKEKVKVIGLEVTDASKPFDQVDYPSPIGLVVGNEALGVSLEVLEMADEIVQIPMWGFKNSVNVAVAFGVVVFEVVRQFRDAGSLILDPTEEINP